MSRFYTCFCGAEPGGGGGQRSKSVHPWQPGRLRARRVWEAEQGWSGVPPHNTHTLAGKGLSQVSAAGAV